MFLDVLAGRRAGWLPPAEPTLNPTASPDILGADARDAARPRHLTTRQIFSDCLSGLRLQLRDDARRGGQS